MASKKTNNVDTGLLVSYIQSDPDVIDHLALDRRCLALPRRRTRSVAPSLLGSLCLAHCLTPPAAPVSASLTLFLSPSISSFPELVRGSRAAECGICPTQRTFNLSPFA